MTRMTPQRLAEARAIIENLYTTPGCALFRAPVDPVHVPDYRRFVENPQDLGTIRHRLQTDYYSTVEDWIADVNLIWTNAETYNGRDSHVARLAMAMGEKFSKMVKEMTPKTAKEWFDRIAFLYEDLNLSMQKAPPSISMHFQKQLFSGPLDPKQMKMLCDEVSSITNRNDVLQIIQVLTLFGANIDFQKTSTVNVRELPASAFRALSRFMREKRLKARRAI